MSIAIYKTRKDFLDEATNIINDKIEIMRRVGYSTEMDGNIAFDTYGTPLLDGAEMDENHYPMLIAMHPFISEVIPNRNEINGEIVLIAVNLVYMSNRDMRYLRYPKSRCSRPFVESITPEFCEAFLERQCRSDAEELNQKPPHIQAVAMDLLNPLYKHISDVCERDSKVLVRRAYLTIFNALPHPHPQRIIETHGQYRAPIYIVFTKELANNLFNAKLANKEKYTKNKQEKASIMARAMAYIQKHQALKRKILRGIAA